MRVAFVSTFVTRDVAFLEFLAAYFQCTLSSSIISVRHDFEEDTLPLFDHFAQIIESPLVEC